MASSTSTCSTTRLEFKVAAAWNPKTASKDVGMRDNIVQEVAAFMNSPEGGAVLIGVADDGTVVGLEDDYRAADKNKPNRDGCELFLRNALSGCLGGDSALYYGICFHAVVGKEVCRVNVKPSDGPVYFRGDLYVRSGNGKRKLKLHPEYLVKDGKRQFSLEPMVGFEPTTCRLRIGCSTAELHWPIFAVAFPASS